MKKTEITFSPTQYEVSLFNYEEYEPTSGMISLFKVYFLLQKSYKNRNK